MTTPQPWCPRHWHKTSAECTCANAFTADCESKLKDFPLLKHLLNGLPQSMPFALRDRGIGCCCTIRIMGVRRADEDTTLSARPWDARTLVRSSNIPWLGNLPVHSLWRGFFKPRVSVSHPCTWPQPLVGTLSNSFICLVTPHFATLSCLILGFHTSIRHSPHSHPNP